jgi:alkylated DNA repair dioxygenase AlkB
MADNAIIYNVNEWNVGDIRFSRNWLIPRGIEDSGSLGYCYLYKAVLPDADKYLSLYEGLDFSNIIELIPGQPKKMKRYRASCGDYDDLAYSYTQKPDYAVKWTPMMRDMKDVIEQMTGNTFNYALINAYSDSSVVIGHHADKELELEPGYPIISVNIGATRDFQIKPRKGTLGEYHWKNWQSNKLVKGYLNIELSHGDVLVMGGDMQKNFTHAVPKRANDKPLVMNVNGSTVEINMRFNITFRNLRTDVNWFEYDSD